MWENNKRIYELSLEIVSAYEYAFKVMNKKEIILIKFYVVVSV